MSKRDELLVQIATEEPDITAITETLANTNHLMSEFSVKGYESFYKNRGHKKGGGVIFYVRSTFNATKKEKQDAEKYDTRYVEIVTKKTKITIATIYRSPKLQAVDDAMLYEEIKTVIQNKQTIIIGDFNCPNIDWNTMNGDQEGNRLIEMVEDSFLTQDVKQPTRGDNILDLVLASDPDLISDCEVDEKLNGCDHHLIRFNIMMNIALIEINAKIPNFKKANFNLARLTTFSGQESNISDERGNSQGQLQEQALGI